MNDEILVGLDIGTTKICAMVGKFTAHGKVELLGMGKAESKGVSRGIVSNIDLTVDAIQTAIAEASEAANVEIGEVNVGIAGQHIRSSQHQYQYIRRSSEHEISHAEINEMREAMMRIAIPPGFRIIDVIPQEYTVDGEKNIQNPVGMAGAVIQGSYHVITGQISAIENIYRCVRRAGLEVSNLTLEPIASSESVLTPEEKEAGVVLIDIGGGTTDIAIFHEHVIRHSAVLPFGGNIITQDIQEGCIVLKAQAELMKTRFGSALTTEVSANEIITIPGIRGREPREISMHNLASIIQARMEEILEMVDGQIHHSGIRHKLAAGIVITGGGALLRHLRPLVEFKTGLPTRIGYPFEHLAQGGLEIKSPVYATSVGLIITDRQEKARKALLQDLAKPGQGALPTKENPELPENPTESRGSIIQNFFQKIKKLLEDNDESIQS